MDPWVGKIPWRRAWQPTPGFLPGESPRPEEAGGLQSTGSPSVGSHLEIEPKQEKGNPTERRARRRARPGRLFSRAERAGRGDGESEGPRGRGRGSETLGLVPAAPGAGPGEGSRGRPTSCSTSADWSGACKGNSRPGACLQRSGPPLPRGFPLVRWLRKGEPAVSERPVPFSSSLAIPSLLGTLSSRR